MVSFAPPKTSNPEVFRRAGCWFDRAIPHLLRLFPTEENNPCTTGCTRFINGTCSSYLALTDSKIVEKLTSEVANELA